MFDNIGGKIKTLASIIAWLGIIVSVIIGIILMISAEEFGFAGLIIVIVGSISESNGCHASCHNSSQNKSKCLLHFAFPPSVWKTDV